MSEYEREEYYRQRAAEVQRGIVNFKSSTTLTSESFIWTYRTTSVDVISLITTTVPIKNGAMNDIKIENREIKRLKPALVKKSKKVDMGDSPFDIGLSVDEEAKRKRLNSMLLSEKNRFMSKLHMSRHIRSTLENNAATKLQATYRGHAVRSTFYELKQSVEINRQIRSNIRSFLANKHNIILSLAKYKKTLTEVRNRSAVTIQSAFSRYLSRKCLRRRRYELYLKRRRAAAVAIQALVRGNSARASVKLLIERIRIVMVMRSVLKIQTAVRALHARRKVHRRRFRLHCFASQVIQNWYRARYSRKMAAHIKAIQQFKKNQAGAMAMQGIVRKFLAKRRTDRIRLRRLHKLIFQYVVKMQCIVRKYLARVSVSRKRLRAIAAKEESDALLAQKQAAILAAQQSAEVQALLESVDLFKQARLGNTTEVEDIYTGLASTEEHNVDDVEASTGDSLLSIAAATGNMDLVRKCLLWGFDMNHRNNAGHNVFMIAAKHNHLQIMQYLLSLPSSTSIGNDSSDANIDASSTDGMTDPAANIDGTDDDAPAVIIRPLEQPISEDDSGYLLVTATANVAIANDLSMLQRLLAMNLNVNAKESFTGMTALHAACELAQVEAFKLLVKSNANLEIEDDMGQTPLHKACGSSMKITELILGLDPNFSTYMSDLMRAMSALKPDADGKDTILLAALGGHTDIMDLLIDLPKSNLKSSKSQRFNLEDSAANGVGGENGVTSTTTTGEISWGPNDISKAIRLVETGNLLCLKKIKDIGFDFNWAEEGTGCTLPIAACKLIGRSSNDSSIDTIDLLMEYNTDFKAADAHGRIPFHYAAQRKDAATLLPHMLMHANATKCQISDQCLLVPDSAGENVFHIAARAGVELNLDLLLTQRVLVEAFEMRNTQNGYTPLMLACSLYQLDIVKNYIKLGADATVLDTLGHSCMWHIYHPSIVTAEEDAVMVTVAEKRPIGSEYLSQQRQQQQQLQQLTGNSQQIHHNAHRSSNSHTQQHHHHHSHVSSSGSGSGGSAAAAAVSRSERHDELEEEGSNSARVKIEVSTVIALLHAGCKMYSNYDMTADDMRRDLAYQWDAIMPSIVAQQSYQPGDIAVQEMSMTLLKAIINGSGGSNSNEEPSSESCSSNNNNIISIADAWRLLLSSIWFDDGSSRVLLTLLRAGIIDILVASDDISTSNNSNIDMVSGDTTITAATTTMPPGIASSSSSASEKAVHLNFHHNNNNNNNNISNNNHSQHYDSNHHQQQQQHNQHNNHHHHHHHHHESNNPHSNNNNTENFHLNRMQSMYYMNLTLLGWAIQLGKPRVVHFLLKKGLDAKLAVDTAGNSALHFIAMQSQLQYALDTSNTTISARTGSSSNCSSSSKVIVDLIDTVLQADQKIRIECTNRMGSTASMLATKYNNFAAAKRLFQKYHADSRRSLNGSYAAWVLAFVRIKEKCEVNLQTGRYGDDDDVYFSIAPDPFFTTWYIPS